MEKLIVKNFGPIKEAEIDLTKYVVFIGDTSTGKSVLAKLIAICRDSFMHLSILKERNEIDITEKLRKFNINFDISETEISYFFDGFKSVELKNDKLILTHSGFKLALLDQLENLMNTDTDKYLFTKMLDFDKSRLYEIAIDAMLSRINSVYFPAERIIYILAGNSLAGLWANNISLPDCYKEFAARFETARKNFKKFESDILNLKYEFNNGVDEILLNDNKILLSEASSGIQSVIPLLLVMNDVINQEGFEHTISLIFEEPELNLFPIKQKKLIEYIISNVKTKGHRVIFTTHSPYILSALDTLILAKNTFNEHPDLKEEINAIISEDKWIDYNDISVYEVRNNGTIKSLKNEEFKSIDVNAIDRVSDIISDEFDKLTELRYAQ